MQLLIFEHFQISTTCVYYADILNPKFNVFYSQASGVTQQILTGECIVFEFPENNHYNKKSGKARHHSQKTERKNKWKIKKHLALNTCSTNKLSLYHADSKRRSVCTLVKTALSKEMFMTMLKPAAIDHLTTKSSEWWLPPVQEFLLSVQSQHEKPTTTERLALYKATRKSALPL